MATHEECSRNIEKKTREIGFKLAHQIVIEVVGFVNIYNKPLLLLFENESSASKPWVFFISTLDASPLNLLTTSVL
jgi:hypothetical protein